MSILVIYPQLDIAYTGGQVYDFNFVKQIRKQQCTLGTLLDKDLDTKNFLSYQVSLIRKISFIKKYDTIVTNSRLYPRLFFLFIFLKLVDRKIKLIAIHHHFNFLTQQGFMRGLHKFLEINFLRLLNIVVIPSPYIKSLMNKYLPKINIKYIELAFDIHHYAEKGNDYVKVKNQLLFVGTIEKRKGIVYLIAMAEYLAKKQQDFHLNIVGKIASSDYYNLLQREIRDKGLNSYITFYGRVSEEKLNELYSSSEIFTFPSLHEGYGMVIVEAMSYGLPVVAFDNSAMPYTIKNGENGLLADNMDSDDFNNKVFSIMNNRELLAKLSSNAYKTYRNSRKKIELDAEISEFICSL